MVIQTPEGSTVAFQESRKQKRDFFEAKLEEMEDNFKSKDIRRFCKDIFTIVIRRYQGGSRLVEGTKETRESMTFTEKPHRWMWYTKL